MKGIIVTGGRCPDFSAVESEFWDASLIIAADSGLDQLHAWGVEPQIIVGDFDSISHRNLLETYAHTEIISAPKDKDYTDTELALEQATSRGVDQVILIGGGEGRLDHSLALLSLFQPESPYKAPTRWYTAKECIIFQEVGTSKYAWDLGSRLSFFPLTPEIEVESMGLVWNVSALNTEKVLGKEGTASKGGSLDSKGSLGYSLSNRTAKETQSITVRRGRLLIIQCF